MKFIMNIKFQSKKQVSGVQDLSTQMEVFQRRGIRPITC